MTSTRLSRHSGSRALKTSASAPSGPPPKVLVAAKGGALIELNSETDFVAKNAEFQTAADEIVAAAAESKAADVDALKAASIGDKTVEQAIADLSAKIGEKLELRRVAFFDGTVETYLHKRAADLPPGRRRAGRVHR